MDRHSILGPGILIVLLPAIVPLISLMRLSCGLLSAASAAVVPFRILLRAWVAEAKGAVQEAVPLLVNKGVLVFLVGI